MAAAPPELPGRLGRHSAPSVLVPLISRSRPGAPRGKELSSRGWKAAFRRSCTRTCRQGPVRIRLLDRSKARSDCMGGSQIFVSHACDREENSKVSNHLVLEGWALASVRCRRDVHQARIHSTTLELLGRLQAPQRKGKREGDGPGQAFRVRGLVRRWTFSSNRSRSSQTPPSAACNSLVG